MTLSQLRSFRLSLGPALAAGLALAGAAACSKSKSAGDESAGTESEEAAQGEHEHEHGEEHAHGEEHGHGEEGHAHAGDDHGHDHGEHYTHSFENPEKYAERWNSDERDEWQRPKAVIEAMGVEAGMAVADIGAGTGYFVPHMSEAVGDEGQVFAIDLEEEMLAYIEDTIEERGLENVETVQAESTDSKLGEASVDRILTLNTWHHIPDREAYTEHLRTRLKDGGSVWVIDYHEESPTGPPVEHRLEPEEVVKELEAGGLKAEVVDLELPRQFAVVGKAD